MMMSHHHHFGILDRPYMHTFITRLNDITTRYNRSELTSKMAYSLRSFSHENDKNYFSVCSFAEVVQTVESDASLLF